MNGLGMDLQTAREIASRDIAAGVQPSAEVRNVLIAHGEWPGKVAVGTGKTKEREMVLWTIVFAGVLWIALRVMAGPAQNRRSKR